MKRRAIRAGRTRSEKRIREAVKESRRLHRAQFDAPLVELEKPYQRGWMRYFRLPEQATRRSDIELLEELLPYVDHIQLCRKGKFETWDSDRTRRISCKHRTRRICLWQFLELRVPERLYRYFRFKSGVRVINSDLLREVLRRCHGATLEVNCEHLFESCTVPYYVTHQRVDRPEVKSKEATLDQWLEQCQGWQKFDRMNGHPVSCWRRYDCYIKRLRRLKRIEESEMRIEVFEFNERRRGRNLESNETEKGTTNVVPFHFPKACPRIGKIEQCTRR